MLISNSKLIANSQSPAPCRSPESAAGGVYCENGCHAIKPKYAIPKVKRRNCGACRNSRSGRAFEVISRLRKRMPQLTYLEAIRQGIWEEMERDPTVFCIGEDIGIYGGAFKVTDGFIDRFGPERVIDTPIAESAIVGAAFGASLTGMRPVAEFQFMDFIGCAFNQIVNMVAKAHYRWGAPAPLVIRGPSGGNVHGGPFHSQNPEMWFVHAPGLKVVCPASAYDAKGLIKAAIRDNNPVIFFEHKYLYRRIKEEVPEEDYTLCRWARPASRVKAVISASLLMRPWCTPRWKPPEPAEQGRN